MMMLMIILLIIMMMMLLIVMTMVMIILMKIFKEILMMMTLIVIMIMIVIMVITMAYFGYRILLIPLHTTNHPVYLVKSMKLIVMMTSYHGAVYVMLMQYYVAMDAMMTYTVKDVSGLCI